MHAHTQLIFYKVFVIFIVFFKLLLLIRSEYVQNDGHSEHIQ